MEFLAIAISVISLAVSWYVQHKQVKLQERMVKLEEEQDQAAKDASQRAAVICVPEWGLNSKQELRKVLRLTNQGACEARNVQVKIDGKPLVEHPCIVDPPQIPVLGPNSPFDIPLWFHKGTPQPPFEITITWEDDSGIKDPPYRTTSNW